MEQRHLVKISPKQPESGIVVIYKPTHTEGVKLPLQSGQSPVPDMLLINKLVIVNCCRFMFKIGVSHLIDQPQNYI